MLPGMFPPHEAAPLEDFPRVDSAAVLEGPSADSAAISKDERQGGDEAKKVRFVKDLSLNCLVRPFAEEYPVLKISFTELSDAGEACASPGMRSVKSTASCRKFEAIYDSDGSPTVRRTTTGAAWLHAATASSGSMRTPMRCRIDSWPSNLGGTTPNMRGEHSVSIMQGGSRHFADEYRLTSELGRGSFGHVWKATRLADGVEVAVKTIASNANDEYLQHEMDITKRLKHPHIAWLHAIFRDDEVVHLVMELCIGGDLFDRLARGQFFSERTIVVYMWQMISGIAYCHHNRFCHRDIKPENYLLDSKGADASLKLIDFGLACKFERGTPMTSTVGSIYYISPEVIKGKYSEKRDIWSIGIVSYMLCTMRVPFRGQTEDELAREISSGRLDMARLEGRFIGKHPLKQLIGRMLTVDDNARPSANELITDDWFRDKGTQELHRPRCCAAFFR